MKRATPSIERHQARDSRGRTWTISIVPTERAEEDDFQFWFALSPEARIELMSECLLDALKTRGKRALPRFRRVYRVLERKAR